MKDTRDSPAHDKSFAYRLRQAIGTQSVLAFAQKCDISDSLVRKYLSGSLPRVDKLVRMAEVAGVSVEWLATGKGPVSETALPRVRDEGAGACLWVYRYPPQRPAADHGHAAPAYMGFDSAWLREQGLESLDLALIAVTGDCMKPTLQPGDILLVAIQGEVTEEGLYVLEQKSRLVPRRLELDLGGGWYIRADNPLYREQHLTGDATGSMGVVGRVICIVQRC